MKIPYPIAAKADIDYVIHLLSTIYPVSDALKAAFYEHVVSLEIEKDEMLVKQGEICEYMYFIKKGAVMGYSIHNRKKITTFISVENEFVSSITGLHGVVPALETMEAVERTSLLALHNDVMQSLFQAHFDFNFVFRVMVEKYYRDAQERSHIIRIGNARERYAHFTKTKPGYIERLPAESVASFLDITPATLLRIKKQFEAAASQKTEIARLCRKIDAHILRHRTYANKDICLSSLAGELGLASNTLSLLLNNHYHLNFADYINTYRINCIKERMAGAGGLQHYTIEAIANEVGFSSRSAFYSAFKKLVGVTPLQYAQSLDNGSPVL